MEGRLPREPKLQREPMLQSEPMGDDSRSYNAPGLIPISPIHGEIHVFLLLQEYSYGSTEVSKVYPTFSIAYSIYSTSQYVLCATYVRKLVYARFLYLASAFIVHNKPNRTATST